MSETRPNVDLHIERLVLDGFAGLDRAALGAAVEAELTRLVAAHGVSPGLAGGGHTPHVDGGRISSGPGASAAALGVQVAQAVYRGLRP